MSTRQEVLERLTSLRLHQQNGRRAPHKPLLVLLALGQLTRVGSSELPWSEAERRLSDLIAEFGPPSRTGRKQRAAYPFTHLCSDGVWTLSKDVPKGRVGPLASHNVVGRLDADSESALRRDPELVRRVARALVEQHFPPTIAPDVLTAAGLDPEDILQAPGVTPVPARRRNAAWRAAVLMAWDRQCAFCGYDGQLGHASVGVEAAHVRWWTLGGPDSPDNGLALCVLHHKLFDFGALGSMRTYASPSRPPSLPVPRPAVRCTTCMAKCCGRVRARLSRQPTMSPGIGERCSRVSR